MFVLFILVSEIINVSQLGLSVDNLIGLESSNDAFRAAPASADDDDVLRGVVVVAHRVDGRPPPELDPPAVESGHDAQHAHPASVRAAAPRQQQQRQQPPNAPLALAVVVSRVGDVPVLAYTPSRALGREQLREHADDADDAELDVVAADAPACAVWTAGRAW